MACLLYACIASRIAKKLFSDSRISLLPNSLGKNVSKLLDLYTRIYVGRQEPNVHVSMLISRGRQVECCWCPHKVDRAICFWGGLDDVSNYSRGDDRGSCRHGTAKPDGMQCPRQAWLHARKVTDTRLRL